MSRNTQTVSQAVAVKDSSPASMIMEYRDRFAEVLPSHIDPKTFVNLAAGALRNAELAKAAANNPGALMVALTDCARLGHEPNTEAYYLVPFKGMITGIEGYRGVIERIYRAGAVTSVHGEVVRATDYYDYEEGWSHPVHKYERLATDAQRGDRVGAFVYAKMRDGGFSRVIDMNAEEIARHRAMNPSADGANSPWVKWPTSMWLKCCAHELEKWVPSSSEYRRQELRAQAEAARIVNAPHQPSGRPARLPDIEGDVVDQSADWPATPDIPDGSE